MNIIYKLDDIKLPLIPLLVAYFCGYSYYPEDEKNIKGSRVKFEMWKRPSLDMMEAGNKLMLYSLSRESLIS
jgi:hypothetical protein